MASLSQFFGYNIDKLFSTVEFRRKVKRIISSLNLSSGSPKKLGLDLKSVGPKVLFTKTNFGTAVDVIIPGVLEITRGENGGLYNAALEQQFNRDTQESPLNTEWNSFYIQNPGSGWRQLDTVDQRDYGTWKNAVENWPPHHVGEELVMREVTTGRMWLIKILSWTTQGLGGGFSYERYEVLPSKDVVKDDYQDDFVDIINPGKLELTRGLNGGLFNRVSETEYNGNSSSNNNQNGYAYTSPLGTEWNSEFVDQMNYGFDNLGNVRTRKYANFYDALNKNIGNNILETALIMHDLTSDAYYKVEFTSWTGNNNGGGLAYTRTLIPLDEAIVFADGTVLGSATAGQTFDQSLNTGDAVTFHVLNVQGISAETISTSSNNQGNNVSIGDDCFIGDVGVANGFGITGQENPAEGYIKLGNDATAPVVGNKGSGRLNISKLDGGVGLDDHANNAAALSAGLVVGDLYKTGDTIKIVH